MKKASTVIEALLLMTALQAARIGLRFLAGAFVPDTDFAGRMTTMVIMLLFTGVTVIYARLRGTKLSIFPQKFGKKYIIFTCVAVLLYATAPSNFTGGYQAIALLVYGSIVTPVFEELVFRGYVWNRTKTAFSSELSVYLLNVAYFTLWHLGYMLGPLSAGNWSAVLWKLAAGLGYGAVLGFVRLKANNCYAAILAHGILNLFMV